MIRQSTRPIQFENLVNVLHHLAVVDPQNSPMTSAPLGRALAGLGIGITPSGHQDQQQQKQADREG